MLDLKAKYVFEDMYGDGKHWNCIFTTEEKQQILQDHEDAKKCEILESNLKARDCELSSEIRQNTKLKEFLGKDRQIVKRVEEWKNKVDKVGWDDADVPINIFQKIIEGKK